MKKEEIEPKLANVMSAVSECEGLICAGTDGKVVVGQTLTEMNHAAIASSAATLVKTDIGKPSNKGGLKDITIGLDKGYLIIIVKGTNMLIGLLGEDGKNAVGLLTRQLKLLLG
jgi:predicted regulator of Ras-like GTPase activity (Roadblock/LC7/MglB family)